MKNQILSRILLLLSMIAITLLVACSDNKQEEKTIQQHQEELGHQAAEQIKQPIEQAEKMREMVEKKNNKALEGC